METKELKLTIFEAQELADVLKKQMDMFLRTRTNDFGFSVGGEYQKASIRVSKVSNDKEAYVVFQLKDMKKNEN